MSKYLASSLLPQFPNARLGHGQPLASVLQDYLSRNIGTLEYVVWGLTFYVSARTMPPNPPVTHSQIQHRLDGIWTLLNLTAVFQPLSQEKIIAILQRIRQAPPISFRVPGEGLVGSFSTHHWSELSGWQANWTKIYKGEIDILRASILPIRLTRELSPRTGLVWGSIIV